MPFDANLILASDAADWTKANLVDQDYGTPTSLTRNDGGFAVLDIRKSGIHPLTIVLVLTETATSDDALTVIIEESGVVGFGSDVHELGKFDIAAANKGVILGSEAPATVVRNVVVSKQFLRIDASCVTGDDFGTVWCMVAAGVLLGGL